MSLSTPELLKLTEIRKKFTFCDEELMAFQLAEVLAMQLSLGQWWSAKTGFIVASIA